MSDVVLQSMTYAAQRRYHAAAHAHLVEWDVPLCGVVVFWAGRLQGWMRDMAQDRAANGHLTHRPGCIACDVRTGKLYRSVGGDDMAGALQWAPVTDLEDGEWPQ